MTNRMGLQYLATEYGIIHYSCKITDNAVSSHCVIFRRSDKPHISYWYINNVYMKIWYIIIYPYLTLTELWLNHHWVRTRTSDHIPLKNINVTTYPCSAVLSTWASYQMRKMRVTHALGMPGTFSPAPTSKDPGMDHGTCVTHVPWCMSGSLTCGGGENVLSIPGACATRNFTYLARGPLYFHDWNIDNIILPKNEKT